MSQTAASIRDTRGVEADHTEPAPAERIFRLMAALGVLMTGMGLICLVMANG